jgi:hypothetical protein
LEFHVLDHILAQLLKLGFLRVIFTLRIAVVVTVLTLGLVFKTSPIIATVQRGTSVSHDACIDL